MTIPFDELKAKFEQILLSLSFSPKKAALCAQIFAENSRDGVYSHGVNRFPVFAGHVKDGLIDINAEPETTGRRGVVETWDGHLAPGMYTAKLAMDRAIAIAKENAMGCVAVRNTNHWMRGGTYGRQAADNGCIGICATNTIGIMPPWGGSEPKLGNNPLVIAVPRSGGHLVLDMAMSQFSYGKLQEYELRGEQLPVEGGYDEQGNLSRDPVAVKKTQRTLPIGFWKGSGLSFMIDVLVSALSNGRTVRDITEGGEEAGLSQLFICIDGTNLNPKLIEDIISYTKSSTPVEENGNIRYPGEKTLATRIKNEREGIPVNDGIWEKILAL